MKKEKEELQEKLSKFEEKLKEESEGKQNVENRIQSLESKSESFASKLALFEKLSSKGREGREQLRGQSLSKWGEERQTTIIDSMTQVVKTNLNSAWEESIRVMANETHGKVLLLQILDKDMLKDDMIGKERRRVKSLPGAPSIKYHLAYKGCVLNVSILECKVT